MLKRGLFTLLLLMVWLNLTGFAELGSKEKDTLNSLLQQLSTEDLDELEAEQEWAGRVMANVEDSVSIRKEPHEDAAVIGRMFKGDAGEILEQKRGWTMIRSGNAVGWVNNKYLAFGTEAKERAFEDAAKMATVMTETLKVRDEASPKASVTDLIGKGEKIKVGDEIDGWLEISYSDGQSDYISADYVEVAYEYGHAKTLEEIEAEEAAQKAKEEKAKRTKNLGAIAATEDELMLLAALIQAEGDNQPYEGQVAIGAVVMNRVRSGAYPNTIPAVIASPGQFVPAGTGRVSAILASGPRAACIKAAQAAINGETTVGTMTHFKNSASPVSGPSIVIGNHVFY